MPVSSLIFSARGAALRDTFIRCFGAIPVVIASAPGRTELGGNHTDHQGGHVLCAAVDRDMLACARSNGTDMIRIYSEGYAPISIALTTETPCPAGTSEALVQGIATLLRREGYPVGGADIAITSAVAAGSGLSSSASFEVLVGAVLNTLFCGGALHPLQLAQMGQTAENQWFGKPSGLMDQLGCALGGAVAVDFRESVPAIRQLTVTDHGYDLCIIDTAASHADLTAAYAAIPADMRAVAQYFGQNMLSRVDPDAFWNHLRQVRAACGDRAVLRAAHFFDEDQRAQQQADAIAADDFPAFLELVRASGHSSAASLQNLFDRQDIQPVTLALALCDHLLQGQGAARVHGGGFAGTVQAWVPRAMTSTFRAAIETQFGRCEVMQIRREGVYCCKYD